jgi:hypothetical protein
MTRQQFIKKISSMFLHQENKRYMYNAIDSLFYDIEKLNQRIIELNQSREQYAGLFKFFNNIQIIMKDGQTHHFDGDYNQFHQFVFENLFEIKSITIKEKEIQC